MLFKIEQYENGEMDYDKLCESFQGWQAYAMWANTYKLRKNVIRRLIINPQKFSRTRC